MPSKKQFPEVQTTTNRDRGGGGAGRAKAPHFESLVNRPPSHTHTHTHTFKAAPRSLSNQFLTVSLYSTDYSWIKYLEINIVLNKTNMTRL